MRISKKKLMNRGLVGALAAASLVLGTTSPAVAQEDATLVGAGAGAGWEFADNPGDPNPCPNNPLSDDLPSSEIELFHPAATYDAVDPTPPTSPRVVSYVGDARIKVKLPPHYISPLGTHRNPEECLAPSPVPIETAEVVGVGTHIPGVTTNTGAVSCKSTNGSFLRVQSAVVLEFTGLCTVSGNVVPFNVGTVNDVKTQHVWEGTMVPCLIPPFDVPNPECAAGAAAFPPRTEPSSFLTGAFEAESVALLP